MCASIVLEISNEDIDKKFHLFIEITDRMKKNLDKIANQIIGKVEQNKNTKRVLMYKNYFPQIVNDIINSTVKNYNNKSKKLCNKDSDSPELYDLFNKEKLYFQRELYGVYNNEVKILNLLVDSINKNELNNFTSDEQMINKQSKYIEKILNHIEIIEDELIPSKHISSKPTFISDYDKIKKVINVFRTYYYSVVMFIYNTFNGDVHYVDIKLCENTHNILHKFIKDLGKESSIIERFKMGFKYIISLDDENEKRNIEIQRYCDMIGDAIRSEEYSEKRIIDVLDVYSQPKSKQISYIEKCYHTIVDFIKSMKKKNQELLPKKNGIELGFILIDCDTKEKYYYKIYTNTHIETTHCFYFNEILGGIDECGVVMNKYERNGLSFICSNEVKLNPKLDISQKAINMVKIIYYSLVLNCKDLHCENIIYSHIIDMIYPFGNDKRTVLYNDIYNIIKSLNDLNTNFKEYLTYYDDNYRYPVISYDKSKRVQLTHKDKLYLSKLLSNNSLSSCLFKMFIYSQSFNTYYRDIDTDPLWYNCKEWNNYYECSNEMVLKTITKIYNKITNQLSNNSDIISKVILQRNEYIFSLCSEIKSDNLINS